MKLLVDECLHTSLLDLAHAAGHAADHVNYLGLGGTTDRKLIAVTRLPAARERLTSIVARHDGRLPEMVLPTFMVIIGVFAMLAEAEMLSPVHGLVRHHQSIWTAPRCVRHRLCVCEHPSSQHRKASLQVALRPTSSGFSVSLASSASLGLVWAGITRGRQAAFGASLSGSPLAGFIGNNSVLAMIVYTFFTVAFPVAGAVAITFGMKAAREWREFLLAKRDVAQLNTIAAKVPKELESEQKKLRHELNTLESTRDEWQKVYLVQHQRGTAIGAAQTPKWMVWVKAGFVALVALLLSLPAMAWPIIPLVATLTAYVGARVYFHKAWAHPKPHQLYSQQNVEFRNPQGPGGAR